MHVKLDGAIWIACGPDRPAIPLKEKRMAGPYPVLVAEVVYRGWSGDGVLRRASQGLSKR